MNKLGYLLAFLAGGAAGAFIAFKVLESKKDEEVIAIDWKKTKDENREPAKEETLKKTDSSEKSSVFGKSSLTEYTDIISEKQYTNYRQVPDEERDEDTEDEDEGDVTMDEPICSNEPIYIEPCEFGEKDGYDSVTYIYYADGFLADEDDELIEDVRGTVGLTFKKHFGEYEDDSVFVRNDRLKIDIQILSSLKDYADVAREKEAKIGLL